MAAAAPQPTRASHAAGPLGPLAAFSDALADLVEQVLPHIVALSGNDSCGSGFVLDSARRVVTNSHVIEGFGDEPITAVLHGAPKQSARVVGRDKYTDLAVVELAEPHEGFLELREAPARLGELCVALGSPMGFTESVSLGIVSGLARSITHDSTLRPLERALQTDCAINHGNSGGPLIDVSGRVIGVNTAVYETAHSIGFAVPAATVRSIADALIADGKVVRASLGIAVAEREVEIDGRPLRREVVTKVRRPQEKGLAVGDVLLSIAGTDVDGRAALYDLLGRERIGQKVAVVVQRDGRKQDLEMVPEQLAEAD